MITVLITEPRFRSPRNTDNTRLVELGVKRRIAPPSATARNIERRFKLTFRHAAPWASISGVTLFDWIHRVSGRINAMEGNVSLEIVAILTL